MKKIDVSQTINTLANLGVIAGILLLAFEVRQAYQATELQAAQAYLSIAHELDFRLVDDPSTYPLVFEQPQDLSPVDQWRQNRWLFAVLRTWENGYYLNKRGALADELWAGQDAWIAAAMTNRNEVHDYLQNNAEYFSQSFVQYLKGLRESESD